MTEVDVPHVLAIQEPASVVGLASVFPQERFPFPRDSVEARWLEEIGTPGIDCYVVSDGEAVVGFAASRDDELLHFGIALEQWGTGVAQQAHDSLVHLMRLRGVDRAWLRVFAGNGRARRFYEKRGWRPTGERSRSSFPPNPELIHYELDITANSSLLG